MVTNLIKIAAFTKDKKNDVHQRNAEKAESPEQPKTTHNEMMKDL